MVDGQVVGAVAHQGAGIDRKGTGSVATPIRDQPGLVSRHADGLSRTPRITPCIANQCSLSFTAPVDRVAFLQD